MADPKIKPTTIEPPPKNPHNIEATKYYVFNETGNIMMSSTLDANTPMSEEVQKVFAEVSVFFAAMSRAITTTMNPKTGKPYSLYNYTALQNVISGSGLFVHVTEEDVSHTSKSGGVTFSKELLESLLGLATGTGEMAFASAMISSIGKEGLTISASTETDKSAVGNIVFVCEYLLGMPSISAIVVYADMEKNKTAFQVGPCIKGQSSSINLQMHKDTYMFVTPAFIHEYAGDLDSINSDGQYLELVNWLSGLVLQTPTVFNVADAGNNYTTVESGDALTAGEQYALQGQFLPTKKVTLKFTNSKTTATIKSTTLEVDQIQFTVQGEMGELSAINVVETTKDGTDEIVATSPGSYTVVKKPS